MVTARDDVAYIAGLHSIIAVFVHQIERILEVTFIVERTGRGLVVHEKFHTLRVGILVQPLEVEVRVRCDEVEHILLPVAEPVLPADVPAFHKHLLHSVGSSEVDILLHVGSVRRMAAVGLGVCIVGLPELHGTELIRISPRLAACYHLPPHTAVLGGMNPGSVLDLAGFVEVKNEVACQHIPCIVAYHHRTPWGLARCLHKSFQTCRIRREPRLEGHCFVVEVEVHSSIISTCRLVDVDVETVGRLHLQGGLYARFREHVYRGVAPVHGIMKARTNLRELRLLCLLLLRVIVAGKPPGCVVASHGKLRMLLFDDKIVQFGLLRELIAESHAVVIDTETDDDVASAGRLAEVYLQLVVVVADGSRLAPYRLPCLVESSRPGAGLLKTVHEAGFPHALAGMPVLGQFKS